MKYPLEKKSEEQMENRIRAERYRPLERKELNIRTIGNTTSL
jgi:hypothetical protein